MAVLAGWTGHADVLRALRERGADLGAATRPGQYTAAHVAAQFGHLHCLRLLADHHCDLSVEAEDFQVPVTLAVMGGWVDCLRFLHGECGCRCRCRARRGPAGQGRWTCTPCTLRPSTATSTACAT